MKRSILFAMTLGSGLVAAVTGTVHGARRVTETGTVNRAGRACSSACQVHLPLAIPVLRQRLLRISIC